VVPEDWVQVAEGFGIDLAAHRSERVDALIDTADLFVVMTADHARDLAMLDRRALGRIVTLSGASERIGRACAAGTLPGSLVGDQRGLDVLNMNRSGDVPDPYRQARREQQRIAAHIVELCERLAGGWSR
jgi:protein-tyrosine-phosphatase